MDEIQEYIAGEITSYLEDMGNLWTEYGVEEGDIEGLREELNQDDNMRTVICNEVIYDDKDTVLANLDWLDKGADEFGYDYVGEMFCKGRWNVLESVIREAVFYDVYENTVEEFLGDKGYVKHEVELSDEDYDEGFEESVRRHKRRIR